MQTKTLLNVREVADQLGIKPSTVRAWLTARKLPRVYCGRCVRVPAEAVTKFVAEHTIPARTGKQ